jgi:transposase
MQDHELYRRILGIEAPWQVERVELKLQQGEVHVYLAHQDNREWACALCGVRGPLYDHQPEREWRHLDTCQYRTILHASPPRTQCAEHGVRVVKLPWAEPGSRFTELFEALAIEWLKHASQQAVGDRLQLSWDEIHGIMERAVRRGLARRQAEERGGSGVRRLFPTHNPTHKKYVLYELPRTLAVPAVLYVVVKPMSALTR